MSNLIYCFWWARVSGSWGTLSWVWLPSERRKRHNSRNLNSLTRRLVLCCMERNYLKFGTSRTINLNRLQLISICVTFSCIVGNWTTPLLWLEIIRCRKFFPEGEMVFELCVIRNHFVFMKKIIQLYIITLYTLTEDHNHRVHCCRSRPWI